MYDLSFICVIIYSANTTVPANITAEAGQVGVLRDERWEYRGVRPVYFVALFAGPHSHFVFVVESDHLTDFHRWRSVAAFHCVTVALDGSVFLNQTIQIFFTITVSLVCDGEQLLKTIKICYADFCRYSKRAAKFRRNSSSDKTILALILLVLRATRFIVFLNTLLNFVVNLSQQRTNLYTPRTGFGV